MSAELGLPPAQVVAELATWYLPPLVGATLALGLVARLLLALPAVVLEPLGTLGGLRRSWRLSRGAALRIGVALLTLVGLSALLVALPQATLIVALGTDELPRTPEVLASPILLTVLYYQQRVRHEAFDLEVSAKHQAQQEVAALQKQASALLRAEAYAEAIPLLDRAIALSPDAPSLRAYRQGVREKTSDFAGALSDAEHVVAQFPSDPYALCNRAAAHEAVGDRAAAALDYGRVLAIRPSFPEELHREAERLLAEGRFFDVLGYLSMLEALEPEDSWAFYAEAVARAQIGRSEQAVEKLERALALSPGLIAEAGNEPAFISLREHPRFKALLRGLANPAG
jgi:tetratricopeptide (TPR) repeat protein